MPHGTVLSATKFTSVALSEDLEDGLVMYEVTLLTAGHMQIGWCPPPSLFPFSDTLGIGDFPMTIGIDGFRGMVWNVKGSTCINRWAVGDCLTCYADLTRGIFDFALNGEVLASQQLHTCTSLQQLADVVVERGVERATLFRPAITLGGDQSCVVNTGRSPFRYPREGYAAACAEHQEDLMHFFRHVDLGTPGSWGDPLRVAWAAVGELQLDPTGRWNTFCMCIIRYLLQPIADEEAMQPAVHQLLESLQRFLSHKQFEALPSTLVVALVHLVASPSLPEEPHVAAAVAVSQAATTQLEPQQLGSDPRSDGPGVEWSRQHSQRVIEAIFTFPAARRAVVGSQAAIMGIVLGLFSPRRLRITSAAGGLAEDPPASPAAVEATVSIIQHHTRPLAKFMGVSTAILKELLDDPMCASTILRVISRFVSLISTKSFSTFSRWLCPLAFDVSDARVVALHLFVALVTIIEERWRQAHVRGESVDAFIARAYPATEFARGPLWYACHVARTTNDQGHNEDATIVAQSQDLRIGGTFEVAWRKAHPTTPTVERAHGSATQQGTLSANTDAGVVAESETVPAPLSVAIGLFGQGVRPLLLAIPADARKLHRNLCEAASPPSHEGRCVEIPQSLVSGAVMFAHGHECRISSFCLMLDSIVQHYYRQLLAARHLDGEVGSGGQPAADGPGKCSRDFLLLPMSILDCFRELWLFLRALSPQYPRLVQAFAPNVMAFFSACCMDDQCNPKVREMFLASMATILDVNAANREAVARVVMSQGEAGRRALECVLRDLLAVFCDGHTYVTAMNVLCRLCVAEHMVPHRFDDVSVNWQLLRDCIHTVQPAAPKPPAAMDGSSSPTHGDGAAPALSLDADAYYALVFSGALASLSLASRPSRREEWRVFAAAVNHANTTLSDFSGQLFHRPQEGDLAAPMLRLLVTLYTLTGKSLYVLDFLWAAMLRNGAFEAVQPRPQSSQEGVAHAAVPENAQPNPSEHVGILSNMINLLLQVTLRVRPVCASSPHPRGLTRESRENSSGGSVVAPQPLLLSQGAGEPNESQCDRRCDLIFGDYPSIDVEEEPTTEVATVSGLLAPVLSMVHRILIEFGSDLGTNPFFRASGRDIGECLLRNVHQITLWPIWSPQLLGRGAFEIVASLQSICAELAARGRVSGPSTMSDKSPEGLLGAGAAMVPGAGGADVQERRTGSDTSANTKPKPRRSGSKQTRARPSSEADPNDPSPCDSVVFVSGSEAEDDTEVVRTHRRAGNETCSETDFTCSICADREVDALILPCRHMTCHMCVARYLATNGANTCFFCKQPIEEVAGIGQERLRGLLSNSSAGHTGGSVGAKELVPQTGSVAGNLLSLLDDELPRLFRGNGPQ